MLDTIPNKKQIESLLGEIAMEAWNELIQFVESNYEFVPVWDEGGKYGVWEVKYRKSCRTLFAFYAKEGEFTVLVIFGKAERQKFELIQNEFSSKIIELYSNIR